MINKSTDKILCVDDEENILHMFRRNLGRKYDLYTAVSAENALNLIHQHPDFALIISDYTMPLINGVEFLKLARTLLPNSVQIMLTGNIELDIAIKTINETNVFRYLPKPFPIEDLQIVISDALNQYHLIISKQQLDLEITCKNQELAASNLKLNTQKKLLEYELEMAKTVFSKVSAEGDYNQDGLDYVLKPKDTIGGDFLLTQINRTEKSFYLMMGDLTGHGLSSALAVLLVTEVFDTLCLANPNLEQLACGINNKMCRKLPTGIFCAAFMLKWDWEENTLYIWQGGMPEAYLLDRDGNIIKSFISNNLPLGVLADQDFSNTICKLENLAESSIFLYSDGVIEQCNDDKIMFGYEKLQQTLYNTPQTERKVDKVLDKLTVYKQQSEQCDDISLVELHFSRLYNSLTANQ